MTISLVTVKSQSKLLQLLGDYHRNHLAHVSLSYQMTEHIEQLEQKWILQAVLEQNTLYLRAMKQVLNGCKPLQERSIKQAVLDLDRIHSIIHGLALLSRLYAKQLQLNKEEQEGLQSLNTEYRESIFALYGHGINWPKAKRILMFAGREIIDPGLCSMQSLPQEIKPLEIDQLKSQSCLTLPKPFAPSESAQPKADLLVQYAFLH